MDEELYKLGLEAMMLQKMIKDNTEKLEKVKDKIATLLAEDEKYTIPDI
jgi:hypothetical protein